MNVDVIKSRLVYITTDGNEHPSEFDAAVHQQTIDHLATVTRFLDDKGVTGRQRTLATNILMRFYAWRTMPEVEDGEG